VTQEERTEYAEAVWDEFLLRSRVPRLTMGPVEFDLVRGWMEAVPLRIVLRAIRETRGHGATLNYYASSVSDAYASWRQAVA
jgi:hypothetical protein